MPTWMKVLLALGVLLVVLFVGGAVALYFLARAYGPGLLEAGKQTYGEGVEYGRRTDNEGCLNEAVARQARADGFGGMIKNNVFMRACLEASRPTPGFCDTVPRQTEFMKAIAWQQQQCARYGLPPEKQCGQLFSQVQQFCELHRRRDENSNAAGVEVDAPRAAAAAPGQPRPPATPAQTPAPPPFPARERGASAFEPFVSLSGGRRFESREVEQKPLREDLEFGASYPVLVGDDCPAAREFNRRARAIVMEDVTPYLKERPRPDKDRALGVEMEHHVTHKVVYASDDVVSVLFYVTGYSAPAAHGYHFPVTLNFDLSAGREIELSRVFRPGSGYLSRITKLCDEDLRRQFGGHLHGQMTGLEGGLKPRAKNFRSWVVTPGGLVFIFGEYEVASYADGEPKVLIPFDSLREIIDPRGALARLAAHQ